MKYSIEINAPLEKVVALFLDPGHYAEWKKDFVRYEPLTGTAGQKGTKTKLVFKRVTMIETITNSRLPYEISAEYEHKRGEKTVMIHRAVNRFTTIDNHKTRYETESEITKVVGLLPKIIMSLMAGAAKKYYQNQLNLFKAFAEKENAIH